MFWVLIPTLLDIIICFDILIVSPWKNLISNVANRKCFYISCRRPAKKHNSLKNHIVVESVLLLLMYGLVYKKEKLFSFRKIISFFSWSHELVLIFLGCFLWHYIQLSFFIKLIILYYMISIEVYVASYYTSWSSYFPV